MSVTDLLYIELHNTQRFVHVCLFYNGHEMRIMMHFRQCTEICADVAFNDDISLFYIALYDNLLRKLHVEIYRIVSRWCATELQNITERGIIH